MTEPLELEDGLNRGDIDDLHTTFDAQPDGCLEIRINHSLAYVRTKISPDDFLRLRSWMARHD